MAISYHAICTTAQYATTEVGTNTNKRDVSEMLDLWAHKMTPFLNRLSWGAESGGTAIEWITEHLGYGYIMPASVVASGALSIKAGTSGLTSAGMAVKQLNTGALLFGYQSAQCEICLMLVESICGDNTIIVEYLLPTTCAAMSLAVTDKLYIVANVANEGSEPREDKSRVRTQITNQFAILRKDVQITGSMMNTDMWAVTSEPKHQMANRLLEMQREREMLVMLSITQTRSSTAAGLFNGLYGFLEDQTGNHILQTSQDFTESSVNDVAAELFDNGSNPNVLVASTAQIRKFTSWDRARVRTVPDEKVGGYHITKYLTDTGIEIDLVPMRKFPGNMAFLVDTDKIKLRAKKNRKLIVEKLGKRGDFEEWQMLSEFSVEVKGYDSGQHAMWSKLTS